MVNCCGTMERPCNRRADVQEITAVVEGGRGTAGIGWVWQVSGMGVAKKPMRKGGMLPAFRTQKKNKCECGCDDREWGAKTNQMPKLKLNLNNYFQAKHHGTWLNGT